MFVQSTVEYRKMIKFVPTQHETDNYLLLPHVKSK